MKPIKQINGTLSSKFSLGLHADLQIRLYNMILKTAPAKILLEAADIALWKKDIDTESEVARETTASEETARLAQKDQERDRLVTAIFDEIRQAAKSPIVARAEAGRKLKLIVDTYAGLQRETLAEETAHITGLLTDLTKPAALANVNALALAPLINLLRKANSEFDVIRTQRAQVKAADMLPTGAAIRKKNDQTIAAIFRHIEAAYMIAANDADRKIASDLIDKLNRVINESKTSYNESTAQKKRKDGEKKPSTNRKTVEKLLPAFEQENGFAPGTLSLTGKTAKDEDGTKLYELKSASGDSIWVKVEDGKLVKGEKVEK